MAIRPLMALATENPPLPPLTEDGSVGFVHDYLLVLRGAERTFAAMADLDPEAPIYTLLYDPEGTHARFRSRTVRTSYLQHLGVRQSGFRRLLPLFPKAAARLPVAAHDAVISSSSAFAHYVRPRPGALHVCYCHTPFRYAWFEENRALAEAPPILRPALRRTLGRIRERDRAAAGEISHLIANSQVCRSRIQEFWGRDASVIHPPVDVERFRPRPEPEDFFLVVAELVRHKRIDFALEAGRRAGRRVVVVGTGPERSNLEARFGAFAEFLGRVSDDKLSDYYSRALALIVPNVEEFGIAAVEAQAAGRPVLGARAGGLKETVVDGKTGLLLPPGDVDALAEVLRYHEFRSYSPLRISQHARRFSADVFRRRLTDTIRALQGLGRSGSDPGTRKPGPP